MRNYPERDNFPDDFYDALGRVIVAFGRIEYVMKLTVKSLYGEGFSIGMAHAESRGAFHRLCTTGKRLATEKLPNDKAAQYKALVDRAIALAPNRNDNSHAFWTVDDNDLPLRLRPYLPTKPKPTELEWRTRSVVPGKLREIAARMDELYRELNSARRAWPPLRKLSPRRE